MYHTLVPIDPAVVAAAPTSKHHRWGPSSLKSREICPGYKNDNSGDNTASDEGTMLHNAVETGNLAGLNAEQTEQVNKCLGYVEPLVKKALEVHREVKLDVLGGMTFGTADMVILRLLPNAGQKKKLSDGYKHADLVDFKFGRVAVDDAEDNRQGYAYVLGVFERWAEVDSVTVHFLSPRRDEILRHTFYRSDIPRLSMIISTIISNADHYDKTRDPSMLRLNETNCTYCYRRGKPECPVSVAYMVAHAKKYAPLEIADETHSSQITDPAQMAKFFIAIRVLEKMVESGKKHVLAFSKQNDIPGFVRRERKGSVKISNSTLAYPVLKQILDPEELASCCEFKYGDILKLVSDKAEKGKKTEAAKQLYIALSNAECVTSGEPTEYLQRLKEDPVEEKIAAPVSTEPATIPAKTAESPATPTAPKSCVTGPAVA